MLDAHPVTVDDLFRGSIQYQIPVYQRHYVWQKEDQWKPLWQDIIEKVEENGRIAEYQEINPHFFGAIVTLQLPRRVGAISSYEIIDGQQRLTTFQIILCAICNVCYSAKLGDLADKAHEYIANSGLLTDRFDSSKLRDSDEKYKILPTKVDKDSFASLIDGENNKVLGTIGEALNYFTTEIRNYMNSHESEIDRLQDPRGRMNYLLDTILKDFKVVQILVDRRANTGRIFESINARGRTINEFDLLRNNIFLRVRFKERPEDVEGTIENLHKDFWGHFEDGFWTEKLGTDDGEILESERFLQHFLMAKLKRENVVHQDLFHIYGREYQATLAKDQGVEYELRELQKYSEVYRVMLDCMYDSSSSSGVHSKRKMDLIANRMEFYKNLKISSWNPFILFIVNELNITFSELEKIFDILESYTMRRLLCSNRRNPNFSKLFAKILSIGTSDSVSGKLMRYLSTLESGEKCPNDDEVKRALSRCGDDSFDRSITRYVLYRIELFKEGDDSTLRNKLKFGSWLTREHVMPKEWRRNWHLPKSHDPKIVEKERDLAIQSIGNLTLLTSKMNKELGNKEFSDKRGPLLKNSDLKITQEIVYESMDPVKERETWDVKEIRDREENLWKCFCNDLWPDVFLYSGELKNWHPTFTKGFIIDEEGQEIPVDSSEFRSSDIPTLKKGSKVNFKKVSTEDGFKAVNVIKRE